MKNSYGEILSFTKISWSYKISIIGIIIIIGYSTLSCEKEPASEYYVKYEVNSSTIYQNGKLDMTRRTEENEDLTLVVNQRTLHEIIIGPIQRGIQCSHDCICTRKYI